MANTPLQTAHLRPEVDHIAPDGSEIRLLLQLENGQVAHCILPPGKTSAATRHRTVSEMWYILAGQGEIWRKLGTEEQITGLATGTAIDIPCGTHFQFRNMGAEPLVILLATLPPWPGPDEAVSVGGIWPIS
jgi:mannose-6-phosphate isomerase-like protein (cupin superfamily)